MKFHIKACNFDQSARCDIPNIAQISHSKDFIFMKCSPFSSFDRWYTGADRFFSGDEKFLLDIYVLAGPEYIH